MKVKILNKDAKWWLREENEWVYQDHDGSWWLYKNEKKNKKGQKKMDSCVNPLENLSSKKIGLLSMLLSWQGIMWLMYTFALGISIALNVYQYLLIKTLSK